MNGGEECLAHEGVSESRWSIADDGIYVIRPTSPATVFRWSPSTNQETPIYKLPTERRLEAGFSVSKNGRRMAWAQVDRHESDILQAVIKGN